MIAPLSPDWLSNVYSMVPRPLLTLQEAKRCFLRDMDDNYCSAIKKGVLDYVLMDKKEQKRLSLDLPEKVGVKG